MWFSALLALFGRTNSIFHYGARKEGVSQVAKFCFGSCILLTTSACLSLHDLCEFTVYRFNRVIVYDDDDYVASTAFHAILSGP